LERYIRRYRYWILLLICLLQVNDLLYAQEAKNDTTTIPKALRRRMEVTSHANDSTLTDSIGTQNQQQLKQIEAPVDTALLIAKSDSIQKAAPQQPLEKKRWIPNPTKATWLALVIPGGGQIYNRKYWKLPIVYGGFVGCAYALAWNNQMYSDYSQAYLDIMDDDPKTDSYKNFLPPNYNITGNESRFQDIFKKKKDYYRRYRDLSVFCFIGVYILSVIDAYVDAELSNFDISRDLGLKVEPAVINNGQNRKNSVGLQCSLRF
jgi:hypothetical protein